MQLSAPPTARHSVNPRLTPGPRRSMYRSHATGRCLLIALLNVGLTAGCIAEFSDESLERSATADCDLDDSPECAQLDDHISLSTDRDDTPSELSAKAAGDVLSRSYLKANAPIHVTIGIGPSSMLQAYGDGVHLDTGSRGDVFRVKYKQDGNAELFSFRHEASGKYVCRGSGSDDHRAVLKSVNNPFTHYSQRCRMRLNDGGSGRYFIKNKKNDDRCLSNAGGNPAKYRQDCSGSDEKWSIRAYCAQDDLFSCGGVCRDLQNDDDHCGSCDNQCAYDETCEQGACTDI